jgi:SHS2 domain-containing protein
MFSGKTSITPDTNIQLGISMVYTYLDHPSDVYVHVTDETLNGMFEDAAAATFGVMLETSKVYARKTMIVKLEADDLEQLLYKWVDYLLFIFDAKSLAIHKTEVKVSNDTKHPSLDAKLFGEQYDPKRHGLKVAVKAMTYSLMQISNVGDRWESYFVLDI